MEADIMDKKHWNNSLQRHHNSDRQDHDFLAACVAPSWQNPQIRAGFMPRFLQGAGDNFHCYPLLPFCYLLMRILAKTTYRCNSTMFRNRSKTLYFTSFTQTSE